MRRNVDELPRNRPVVYAKSSSANVSLRSEAIVKSSSQLQGQTGGQATLAHSNNTHL